MSITSIRGDLACDSWRQAASPPPPAVSGPLGSIALGLARRPPFPVLRIKPLARTPPAGHRAPLGSHCPLQSRLSRLTRSAHTVQSPPVALLSRPALSSLPLASQSPSSTHLPQNPSRRTHRPKPLPRAADRRTPVLVLVRGPHGRSSRRLSKPSSRPNPDRVSCALGRAAAAVRARNRAAR
jgi:hypothetical protein